MAIKEKIPLNFVLAVKPTDIKKSIIKSLYHGITTTYKTQLTNQRMSINAIILECMIYINPSGMFFYFKEITKVLQILH